MTSHLIVDRNFTKNFSLSSSSYNANDFELALSNYALLKDNHRYKNNLESLNWFQFDSPNIYSSKSLDAYASYLTYALIKKFFYEKEIVKLESEKYFTNQLLGFLEVRKKVEPDTIKTLMKYYQKVDQLTDKYLATFSRYTSLNSSQNCHFTCGKDQFTIDIPMVAITSSTTIDVFLIIPYFDKKPNWFTIPSIFKIYKYYADLDIIISNLHITWLNLSLFTTSPIFESIKFSENVAIIVGMYSHIQPYPFENIFSKTNKKYYVTTPLLEITRGILK